MSLPDYQGLMLPLVKALVDGSEHGSPELADAVAQALKLTADDLAERLPSGQATFGNRLAWAKVYLSKAGLIERTRRGWYRLTQRGREVLKENPATVNVKYLGRFPEFAKFYWPSRAAKASKEEADIAVSVGTPEEELDRVYKGLRRALADQLRERILSCPASFFERLVVDLLVAMGYGGSGGDAKAVGRSGDGGIDGVINEDKLGLDVIYIQAKRWKDAVGEPVVRDFVGSLEGKRTRKGVLITTSHFTKEARQYATKIGKSIVLVDGTMLAELMMDQGLGVTSVSTYRVQRIDTDYFDEL